MQAHLRLSPHKSYRFIIFIRFFHFYDAKVLAQFSGAWQNFPQHIIHTRYAPYQFAEGILDRGLLLARMFLHISSQR